MDKAAKDRERDRKKQKKERQKARKDAAAAAKTAAKGKSGRTKPKKKGRRVGGAGAFLKTWLLSIFAIITAFFIGYFFRLQLHYYELGVMEIYAEQQDAFVQLVLDQINLLKNGADSESVTAIIATLDSSSNRYWTLSHGDALVFVKDIAETNRYKSFTASTYYVTEDAQAFIDALSVNRVIHRYVEIRDTTYIASGVAYLYNGMEYDLCLLTNPQVILDHNEYLSARINLTIMLVALLVLFVIVTLGMTLRLDMLRRAKDRTERDNITLRSMAERLNNRLEKGELYDTSLAVFDRELLDELLARVVERRITPVTMAALSFENEEQRRLFLQVSQLMLSKGVVRFYASDNRLLLVGAGQYKDALRHKLSAAFSDGMRLDDIEEYGEADLENITEFAEGM